MSRLTWSDPSGAWGMEGVDLSELPPKIYAALSKLKDYEDAEDCGKAPASYRPPSIFLGGPPLSPCPRSGFGGSGLRFKLETGGADGKTEV